MRRTFLSLAVLGNLAISFAIPPGQQSQLPLTSSGTTDTKSVNYKRQEAVKEAFLFAWNGYKKYSWGYDENRPVSNGPSNSRNGWGATIVDSLDTLLLMDLPEEFDLARTHVAGIDWHDTRGNNLVDAFETNIRYIGGLLGAYDLSDDRLFLDKAVELADLLLPIFDSPTGLPYQFVDFPSGQPVKSGFPRGASVLAEVGSYQLEFTHISQLTGNWTFHHKAQRVNDFFDGLRRTQNFPLGLYPILVDPDTGDFTTSQITYGGLGDSFYEYVIKQYILSGQSNDQLRRLSLESVQSLEKHLLSSPIDRPDIVFLAQLIDGKQRFGMDELACFAPGTLLLFARAMELESIERVARDLTHSCFHAWDATPTGIAPENWGWVDEAKANTTLPNLTKVQLRQLEDWGFYVGWPGYILRPETIESLFYFYRFTGDEKYRDMGWQLFESINRHCRARSGYSGLRDVTKLDILFPERNWDDSQESFFFAETLKYLYLLFNDDPNLIRLDEWVFNTEAHPLRILPSSMRSEWK